MPKFFPSDSTKTRLTKTAISTKAATSEPTRGRKAFKVAVEGVRATVRLRHLKVFPPLISGAVPRDELRLQQQGRKESGEQPTQAEQHLQQSQAAADQSSTRLQDQVSPSVQAKGLANKCKELEEQLAASKAEAEDRIRGLDLKCRELETELQASRAQKECAEPVAQTQADDGGTRPWRDKDASFQQQLPAQEPPSASHDEQQGTRLRDDTLSLLRQEIAANPESFLAEADTDMSGDVSWTEFEAAYKTRDPHYKARDPHVNEEALRTLFDELATAGRIVLDTFLEEVNAANLFVRDAGCAATIVYALLAKVRSLRLRTHHETSPADHSAAEQMRADLAELCMQDILDALQDLLPSTLQLHCAKIKADAKALVSQPGQQGEDSKYAQLPTAAFGDKDSFDVGLGILGAPHQDINDKMRIEMVDSEDSKDVFEAFNSGLNKTTPEKEFFFVVDPFVEIKRDRQTGQVLPPSKWKPKWDYGGNRTPIRLQVFLHVLCAKQFKTTVRFADYKKAHLLPESDPMWLHEEEVLRRRAPPRPPLLSALIVNTDVHVFHLRSSRR